MLHAAQVVEAMDGGTTEVRAEHIVAGNQQAVLALLWAAAVRFEVCLSQFPPRGEFSCSLSAFSWVSAASTDQGLLECRLLSVNFGVCFI